jgi:uncharacterized membrane protein YhfC
MVTTGTFAAMIFTLIICFAVPIGLAVFLYIKKKISLLAVAIGALTFFLMQIMIRIPALQILSQTAFYFRLTAYPFWFALFLGFTAALFEEGGRWLAFRFLMKGHLDHKNALAMGIGHGGIEAMALVGMVYLNYFVIAFMINDGSFQSSIVPVVGESAANQILAVLTGTNSTAFLLAGVERGLTLIIQIAFSMLVYFSVRHHRLIYLGVAMLAHTVLDLLAVYLNQVGVSMYAIEAVVVVFAAVGLWFLIRSERIDSRLLGSEDQEISPPFPEHGPDPVM